MKFLNSILIVTLLLTSTHIRAGGLLGDIINLVAPGLGTALDEAHDEFKDRFDFYMEFEQALTNAIRDPITAACTVPFEVISKSVNAACSNWDHRLENQDMIQKAVEVLVQNNIIPAYEFEGVQIRWCPLPYIPNLDINTEGITPDNGRIYLDTGYRNNSLIDQAVLIAHEMTHIRQFRNLGTTDFKCEYSLDLIKCGGCQDENHALEREAYDFAESARQQLANVGNFYHFLPPVSSTASNQTTLYFSGKPYSFFEGYYNAGPVPEYLQEFAPLLKNVNNIIVSYSYDKSQPDLNPDPNIGDYLEDNKIAIHIPEIGFELSRAGGFFQTSIFNHTSAGSDSLLSYSGSVNIFRSNLHLPSPLTIEGHISGDASMFLSDLLPEKPFNWKNGYFSTIYRASDGGDRVVTISFEPVLFPVPNITQSDSSLNISLGVDSNLNGQYADWWFVKRTPSGSWFYFVYPNGWVYFGSDSNLDFSLAAPYYQGPLVSVTNLKLFETASIPNDGSGNYNLYFGVDTNINGKLDFDQLYYSGYSLYIP